MQLSVPILSDLENLTASLNGQSPVAAPASPTSIPNTTIVPDNTVTSQQSSPNSIMTVQADPNSVLYQTGQSLEGTSAGNAIQAVVNAPTAFSQTPLGGVAGQILSFITGSNVPSGENLLWLGFFGVLLIVGVAGLVVSQPQVQQAITTAAKGATE